MGQSLVFMSNSVIQESIKSCFSAVFCQCEKNLEFRGKTAY